MLKKVKIEPPQRTIMGKNIYFSVILMLSMVSIALVVYQ